MRSTIKIKATKGPRAGREFSFDTHDMFIFGRSSDCQCSIADDAYISSNHFLLEVNPPDCELRDLGSKNGTYVNGMQRGQRERGEAPEMAAARAKPVEIKHGDIIRAGTTEFVVSVQTFRECEGCGKEVFIEHGQAAADGLFLCEKCGPKVDLTPTLPKHAGAAGKLEAQKDRSDGYFTKFLAGIVQPSEAEKLPEFPGYEIEKELNEGGMGKVYLAKRAGGKRAVVKVVKPQGRRIGENQAKMFQREMRVCMALKHPNIVEFYEDGFADGIFFFAMEYCDKGSAADLMGRHCGKLDIQEAGGIVLQALDGLEYAHSKGIVHRDLKPHNILLCGEKKRLAAKIADFGLAKNFDLAGMSGMTASGQEGGTPGFTAKEQIKDYRGTKPVSDVFSMGASLYYMLANEFVYDFDKVADPYTAILRDMVVSIRKRGVKLSEPVIAVIDKALAPNYRERYATAGQFKAALAAALRS